MRTTGWRVSRSLVALGLALAAAAAVAASRPGAANGPAEVREGRHEKVAHEHGIEAWRHVYAPGEGAAMHEHARPRLVVVLSGGTLEAVSPDGEARRIELATGAVSVRGAERHALRNVGPTRIELVEAELLGPG